MSRSQQYHGSFDKDPRFDFDASCFVYLEMQVYSNVFKLNNPGTTIYINCMRRSSLCLIAYLESPASTMVYAAKAIYPHFSPSFPTTNRVTPLEVDYRSRGFADFDGPCPQFLAFQRTGTHAYAGPGQGSLGSVNLPKPSLQSMQIVSSL